MNTLQSISDVVHPLICDKETYSAYQERLAKSLPTRDENPKDHFCAYFLPYNKETKKVFFIHHKKSGLWMSPGGHIDQGEGLLQTLNREVGEELGVRNFFNELPKPFLLTITSIKNTVQPCRSHYDIWFLMPTDGSDFQLDPKEFHDARWLTVEEAGKMKTNSTNLKALDIIRKNNK